MASRTPAVPVNLGDQLSLFESCDGAIEVLQSDLGTEVEWNDEPVFAGRFTGIALDVELTDDRTGDVRTTKLYGFHQLGSNEPRAIWETYQITQAMEKVGEGDLVLFVHKGLRGTGQKQVNVFDIKVKRV